MDLLFNVEPGCHPMRGSNGAAGLDLRSAEIISIPSHVRQMVRTSFRVAIPEGYFGWVASRSGLAKNGIRPTGGIIDSDYRGEVMVILENASEEIFHIAAGDRIAQLIIIPCVRPRLIFSTILPETTRNTSGFG